MSGTRTKKFPKRAKNYPSIAFEFFEIDGAVPVNSLGKIPRE
jgi:hypothetical protein